MWLSSTKKSSISHPLLRELLCFLPVLTRHFVCLFASVNSLHGVPIPPSQQWDLDWPPSKTIRNVPLTIQMSSYS